MKLTKEWLNKKGACSSGIKWFISQDETDAGKVMLKLVEEAKGDAALWVLENKMNKKQSVQLAVFSARLCLEVFENEFPDDDRPRKAIEAAEAYIKNPCEQTKSAAWSAAWSAESARSAASASWSAGAAWSAASAAWSARRAASAARAAWSAGAASAASAASAAWSAARKEIQTKIIKQAIKIMGWEGN